MEPYCIVPYETELTLVDITLLSPRKFQKYVEIKK